MATPMKKMKLFGGGGGDGGGGGSALLPFDVDDDKEEEQASITVTVRLHPRQHRDGDGDSHVRLRDPGHIRALQTLKPRKWLNDIAVNTLLKNFAEPYQDKIVVMNSFLFTKLYSGTEFNQVSTWNTQNFFSEPKKLVILPMHVHDNHWVMCTINPSQRVIRYYDSMRFNAQEVKGFMDLVLEFVWREYCKFYPVDSLDVSAGTFKLSWTHKIREDVPRQSNSIDCGVFMCQNARCVMEEYDKKKSRDLSEIYDQNAIPDIRKEMYDIVAASLYAYENENNKDNKKKISGEGEEEEEQEAGEEEAKEDDAVMI
jgi:sentrin-specific protease 1